MEDYSSLDPFQRLPDTMINSYIPKLVPKRKCVEICPTQLYAESYPFPYIYKDPEMDFRPGFGRKVFDLVTPRFNPLDKRKPATGLIRLGKYMEWD